MALPENEERIVELAEIFRLLGDNSRLRIVLACLDEAVSVGDMAARLNLQPSLVSHHLRLLRAARLLRAERHGKQVHYRAADAHGRRILGDMLDHVAEDVTDTAVEPEPEV
jgi:DNA-binding transcriptional ArsR family regulator